LLLTIPQSIEGVFADTCHSNASVGSILVETGGVGTVTIVEKGEVAGWYIQSCIHGSPNERDDFDKEEVEDSTTLGRTCLHHVRGTSWVDKWVGLLLGSQKLREKCHQSLYVL